MSAADVPCPSLLFGIFSLIADETRVRGSVRISVTTRCVEIAAEEMR
jgi:hypothetical protein